MNRLPPEHFRWPCTTNMPPMPLADLSRKEVDGMKAGYPKHLCHLLEYEYILAIPDSPLSRQYLEWYTTSSHELPIGILLMPYEDSVKVWGLDKTDEADASLLAYGFPPRRPYLIWFIRGFDLSTGSWEDPVSSGSNKRRWLSARMMTEGAWMGKPVIEL